jgi:hypothetical protein
MEHGVAREGGGRLDYNAALELDAQFVFHQLSAADALQTPTTSALGRIVSTQQMMPRTQGVGLGFRVFRMDESANPDLEFCYRRLRIVAEILYINLAEWVTDVARDLAHEAICILEILNLRGDVSCGVQLQRSAKELQSGHNEHENAPERTGEPTASALREAKSFRHI